jgi:hypothetical protein
LTRWSLIWRVRERGRQKMSVAVKKAYYRLIERMKKDMEQIYG